MENVGGIKTTTNIINHKNIEIETTIHKTNHVGQQEGGNKVRSSYVGGSSMLSIMKNSAQGSGGITAGQAP